MKKIHLILFLALTTCFLACKSKQTNTTISNMDFNEKTFQPYFKGGSNDSFWSIEFNDTFLVYKDLNGTRDVYNITAVNMAQDANVKQISTEKGKQKIRITVQYNKCTNKTTSKINDYTLDAVLTANNKEQNLNGCGDYVIPVNLFGKWTLTMFKGNEIPVTKYTKTPYIAFENEDKYVTGNTGCNGYNGPIYFDNNYIRFSNLAVTRKACIHENMEHDFLKELKTITKYKVINNELHFYTADELKMIFKKN
ncbi:META domain-containing protein [Myroides sp. JBRI-B21084]|uniref:META domain-containing protein n=1 Tax=Myroides sp. JBRI-B21084 TaxID=3119977 RepID=UPI0026E43A10|nr:META domain-containing protein [Paenimyroides cloacae]WKW46763.1 META domain-containing protein [Paenimyroides cloacae]